MADDGGAGSSGTPWARGEIAIVALAAAFTLLAVAGMIGLFYDPDNVQLLFTRFTGPLTLIAIVVGLLTLLPRVLSTSSTSRLSRRARYWILGFPAATVVFILVFTFLYVRYHDLDAAFGAPVDSVTTKQAQTIAVSVAGSGPYAGSLEFTPIIVRTGENGDCVVPATLSFVLVADAVPRGNRDARSGERLSLLVPAGTRELGLAMNYVNKDGDECIVRVSLVNGRLVR